MANNSSTQQALAQDTGFRLRLQNALSTVSWQVLGEPENTADHVARVGLARQVLSNNITPTVSVWIVVRPNLLAFATTYDFAARAVVTAATDADIESQLATDWTLIAKTLGF